MRYERTDVGGTGRGEAPSPEWAHLAVVEAFGFPGAGKSALCQGLYGSLGGGDALMLGEPFRKGWKDLGRLQRKLLIGWSALKSPRLVLLLIGLTLRFRLWRNQRTIAHLARLPVLRARLENRSHPTLLLDQAMLQDVWSIFVSAGHGVLPPGAIAPLLSELYRRAPVLVLYLELNVTTAAERIGQREGGGSRFDGLPRQMITDHLTEVAALIDSIVAAASKTGLKITRLDATQPPAVVLNSALEALRLTPATGRAAQSALP